MASHRTVQLLVSVRDDAEARIAVSCGVDILDVKEPTRGSLGDADHHTISQILKVVGRSTPVSVALGELLEPPHSGRQSVGSDGRVLPQARAELLHSLQRDGGCVGFAKIGLANCRHRSDWAELFASEIDTWPKSIQPVAVAYADAETAQSPAWEQVLEVGHRCGCEVFLIDTFFKSGGRLPEIVPLDGLQRLAKQVAQRRMKLALAGSLTQADIAYLVQEVTPDIVAVRSAACPMGRENGVSAQAILGLNRELAFRTASPDGGTERL